jgi:hypothetical protein
MQSGSGLSICLDQTSGGEVNQVRYQDDDDRSDREKYGGSND